MDSRHYQEVTVQRVSSKEKKKREGERDEVEMKREGEGASVIFYLKISFLFSPLYFVRAKWVQRLAWWQMHLIRRHATVPALK